MSAATGARVVLRIRTGLEAADLGFAIARSWWRPLAATWLALVFPVGCVIVWLLRDEPAWSIALLWWLRPAFARVPLHVLSQELFGEKSSIAATARALPRLLGSGLFTSLVTRRLAVSRTFLQPVLQLEGLRGRARRARAAVLTRQDIGAAGAVSAVIAHFNGAFITGLLLLASLLTPAEVEWNVLSIVTGDAAVPAILPALYLLGISVFEPLLVAAGFGLYLNRRVFLEGWEIELAFRRLGARVAEAQRGRRFASAAAALLVLWLAAPHARASDCIPAEPASADPCIQEVLGSADFGAHEKELRWLPKPDKDQKADPVDLSWLGSFAEFLARFAQVVLYTGLAIGLIAVLFALRGVRFDAARDRGPDFPRTFMGLDLDPKSLPADVVAAARELWRRGEAIAALSLLYRAALVRLDERGALEIPESATEFECLRMIRRTQAEGIAGAFGALTHSWIRARYAHEPPNDGEFDALCAGFGAFEAPA